MWDIIKEILLVISVVIALIVITGIIYTVFGGFFAWLTGM